jgi:hypothetical protein
MAGREVDTIGPMLNSLNVKIESPDGTMFVTITEDGNDSPVKIFVHIGKSGSSLAAWANCAVEFIAEAIPRIGLNAVIARLLGITSDKVSYTTDSVTDEGVVTVKSGPEAIAYALIKYRLFKHREHLRKLGVDESDFDETDYRGPSAA